MKSLQKIINYIFEIYENYFDEIIFVLDLMSIVFPVRPNVKNMIMILLIKYLKKKTD